ncbi:unnamed protein product [Victoria cruziana]
MAIFFRPSVSLSLLLAAMAFCFLPTSLAREGVATFYSRTLSCIGGTNATPNPCRGGTVTVTVADLCAGCEPGHLDLSEAAFSTIANPEAGRVRISYHRSI